MPQSLHYCLFAPHICMVLFFTYIPFVVNHTFNATTPNVSQLLTKTKTFKLNQSLTWADFGIYVVTCVICHEQYVGQTSNKFSKRWSGHCSNWNKQDCKTDSDKDQMALLRHYSENHGTINKPPLHEAYTVPFVEQPSCHSLDICENK